MVTRRDILSKAAQDCMEELYSLAQPHITWDEFIEENRIYNKKYEEWKSERNNGWKDKSIQDCIGPRPFEFYYLPHDVFKEVVDSYVHAYKMDNHQELLDIIDLLKRYCDEPITDKWIEGKDDEPGYRGYAHPANLLTNISEILNKHGEFPESVSTEIYDKMKEFLDMAGNFYTWHAELNAFYGATYLGASPNSNKERVIEYWKTYRNKDIEIDESVYEESDDE